MGEGGRRGGREEGGRKRGKRKAGEKKREGEGEREVGRRHSRTGGIGKAGAPHNRGDTCIRYRHGGEGEGSRKAIMHCEEEP